MVDHFRSLTAAKTQENSYVRNAPALTCLLASLLRARLIKRVSLCGCKTPEAIAADLPLDVLRGAQCQYTTDG